INSVFRDTRERGRAEPTPATGAAAGHKDRNSSAEPSSTRPISFQVQVLAATAAAEAELDARLSGNPGGDSLRVAAFQPGGDANSLLNSLREKHDLEVVS